MRTVPTRPWVRCLAACGVAVALGAAAKAQAPAPQPAPAAADDYAARPVAYIFGSTPVTRKDLGEFLIARGGADKLDLVVNKMIIEYEAKKRNLSVTDRELEAALAEDLEGLQVKKGDFVKLVLPRYGKTLYEWMEDVIRPRLMLAKMCRDRVAVDEAALKIQFEREYGEKRKVQIIMWPKGDDLKAIEKEYGKIRASQEEFDRAARNMANPALAASAGNIKPISRHLYAQDKIVEDVAFQLNPGEVSQVLTTSQGFLVMKLHAVLPPDDKVQFEKEKERLQKQAFDEKMTQEIPKFFAELKTQAAPRMIFDGPDQWRTGGGVTPAAAEAPTPVK